MSIDYRDLQWSVKTVTSMNEQAINPSNNRVLFAAWGDEGVVASDAPGAIWIIREADNDYTYVTSTSWPHFPSSFPLLVSRMAVALLSGVWQAGRYLQPRSRLSPHSDTR